MTSLHFLERFILNEVNNYVIVRDQYAQLWDRLGAHTKLNACALCARAFPGLPLKESKFALERAGIRSAVACQCSLDKSIREFKQIATAGADTATGSKFPPK